MSELPHITVATVIPDGDKFLMVRENSDGELVYNQPAGHVELGETILQAAVRETLEETAWHVELQSFLGVYQHKAESSGITYMRHCFIAQAIRCDESRNLDPDIDEALWLTKNEIRDLQDKLRSPMVWRAIEDYESGDCYPLSLFRP